MIAGDLPTLEREIQLAKARFALPREAPVRSCYEAGRDGFWLHRWLIARDVENVVVDSSSIEVNRRARRAVPSSEAEAQRQLTREIFLEAVERPAPERDDFVHAACAGDEDLRRDVQSLLDNDRAASGFCEVLVHR